MAASKTKRTKPALDPAALERELAVLRERLKADGAIQLSKIRPPALKEAAITGSRRKTASRPNTKGPAGIAGSS